jgi:hypothetical protein
MVEVSVRLHEIRDKWRQKILDTCLHAALCNELEKRKVLNKNAPCFPNVSSKDFVTANLCKSCRYGWKKVIRRDIDERCGKQQRKHRLKSNTDHDYSKW